MPVILASVTACSYIPGLGLHLTPPHYVGDPSRALVTECTVQPAKGLGGSDSLFFQCFPEERVRLMWVAEFHPINFEEDEVVQLFWLIASVELCVLLEP